MNEVRRAPPSSCRFWARRRASPWISDFGSYWKKHTHTHTHTTIVFVRLPNCVFSYVCRARTYAIRMYVCVYMYCAGSTVFRRSSCVYLTQHRTRCRLRRQAPRHDLNTAPTRMIGGRTQKSVTNTTSDSRILLFRTIDRIYGLSSRWNLFVSIVV